jgi:SAM-dependent methyltransferase
MVLGAWPRRALAAVGALDLRKLRASAFRCPLCGPSLLVQLNDDEVAIRCARCGATPIAMSLACVLCACAPMLGEARVYELSARGAFHRFLRNRARSLVGSQYVAGAIPGSEVAGIRMEDVQRLTFPSCHFDICTSTEVFEHVPDDRKAFAEMWRVLKPGGLLFFTVPLDMHADTRERARMTDGALLHVLPPEYHRDPAFRERPVLAFRNYGKDIVARLIEAGFSQSWIRYPDVSWFGYSRPVIVALK